jgi:hypothetical protein
MRVVNKSQKQPQQRQKRLAEALKRNIARRKAAKTEPKPKKN